MFKGLKRLLSGDDTDERKPAIGLKAPRALTTILVPQSALDQRAEEPALLVQAVIDFVNAMSEQGAFTNDELPPEAMQAFHCEYYRTQIVSGGHRQLLHNLRSSREGVLRDVDAGLQAMGAGQFHAIFNGLTTWIELNPEASQSQAGPAAERSAELDELDALFRELDEMRPLAKTAATWIAGLPSLKVVHDETILHLMAHTAKLNPHRTDRLTARRIRQFDMALTEPLRLSIGLAASRCDPPEPVIAIGSGTYQRVEGEDAPVMAFQIRTVRAERFGVIGTAGAMIFEKIEGTAVPTPPKSGEPGDLSAAIAALRAAGTPKPKPGKRLSLASEQEGIACAEASRALGAGAALDLLLRMADLDAVKISPSMNRLVEQTEVGPNLEVWVIGPEIPHKAIISKIGAFLLNLQSNEQVATIGRAEIDKHSQRAAVWT